MDNLPNIILWIGLIFGGIPLKSTSELKNMKQLTFSLLGFIWNSTLFLLQEVLYCIVLYMNIMKEISDPKTNRSVNYAMVLDVVSLQILAAVTFLSGTWKYPRIIDVLSTLQRVYRDLQCEKGDVKIQVKVVAIIIITTLLFNISFVNIVMRDLEVFHVFAMSYISITLINCTELGFLLHFTHVAQSIAKGFRKVNFRIKEEITDCIIQGQVMHRVLPDVNSIQKSRNMIPKINRLKSLMNTYWMLCDAVHQANVFYCDQLMAVLFSLFVHITVKSYLFFLEIKVGNVFAITREGAWVLAHIGYVVLLVNSSTEVTNSADKTGEMICSLINKDLEPNIRKELDVFLLQLFRHNARFSARGFFQIHNETLTSMAGAVTTYLVILIQFQTQPQPN